LAGRKKKKKAPTRAAGGKARRPFLLRLPPDVLEEMKRWAANDLRSLNGQIEFVLREALRRRKGEAED